LNLIKILAPDGSEAVEFDKDIGSCEEGGVPSSLGELGRGMTGILPLGEELKRFCPTIHPDLLEYVSLQMTFEAIMKAEIKRRWPL
jgi:hypothetical protein